MSGSAKFFLGTDSAPHGRQAKESACGCAGIFNAPYALETYAGVFEEEGALDRLEAFAAVTVPPSSNAGRRVGSFAKSTRPGSSSALTVMLPLRPGTSSGTISSAKDPFPTASWARRYERSA